MKAVVVADFGAQPELTDLPVPEPGPGELLVRVHAAGMNPFAWKVADGAIPRRGSHGDADEQHHGQDEQQADNDCEDDRAAPLGVTDPLAARCPIEAAANERP
jgi:hypothetical protein